MEIGDVYRKLSSLAVETDGSTTEDVNSARPSFEITSPDNTTQPLTNTERRPSVIFSDPAPPGPPRSMPSMSPRLTAMEEEGTRGSFSFSRRGSRVTKSNSGSRAGSQTGENRISSTFSRFAGRLSRDKMTSDGEGEIEESALEIDDAAADDINLGPARLSLREKSGKSRSQRGKSKDKSRKPDRECVVM